MASSENSPAETGVRRTNRNGPAPKPYEEWSSPTHPSGNVASRTVVGWALADHTRTKFVADGTVYAVSYPRR